MESFENKYTRLFETAKDGILILNADNGRIEDVNPYLAKLLGYPKNRLLEKSIWDISSTQNIEYSKQLYKELKAKKYVRYEDLPLQASDGSLIDVEIVSNVYKVNKEKVIQCNIREISKRKDLEKITQETIKTKEASTGQGCPDKSFHIKHLFNSIPSPISYLGCFLIFIPDSGNCKRTRLT